MIVIEPVERPADHGITKMPRSIVLRDLGRQPLSDSKVCCLPGDRFVKTNQSADATINGPFICVCCRLHMEVNAARKVEDDFAASIDSRFNFDNGHDDPSTTDDQRNGAGVVLWTLEQIR